MNKFLILILSLTLLSCFGKDQNNKENHQEITLKKNEYEQLSNESSFKSNEILSIADFSSIKKLQVSLFFFKESERTFLNINEVFFKVNWLYKIENNNINTNEILLFKKDSDYVLLIPTFSEEFPSYQIIEIKNKSFIDYGNHTYSPEDFEKLENFSFDKVKYQLKNLNGRPQIIAVFNNKEVLLSDYSKNRNVDMPVTSTEKDEIRKLKAQNNNIKNTTQNIYLDIDSDGNKENFEINFNNRTIKTSKKNQNEIYFEKNKLVVQKEIQESNPHDLMNYKYYFFYANNSIDLEKIEFKRETYIENTNLCKINYTYYPKKNIHISTVDFFNHFFLQSLIRNINLNQAIEISAKINQNYNCTSNLSKIELEFLLGKTILDDNSVNNYNNLAYYLEQNKQYETSCYLLKKIIEKYPNRIVAWLNYGDALWELAEKSDAKNAYQKYISLMKSESKNMQKIPQRVYERSK